MQLSVEPGAVSASSARVAEVGATFAAMSGAVRQCSATAAPAAGTPHAQAGLEDFGEHWAAVLRVLAAAGEVVQEHLAGAARGYRAVDDGVVRPGS